MMYGRDAWSFLQLVEYLGLPNVGCGRCSPNKLIKVLCYARVKLVPLTRSDTILWLIS